ncbi:MAG: T9SS type A sorting domain-containing protein, partial [bacterium]
PGATGTTYLALVNGEYWDRVIINNCISDTSNHIFVVVTGEETYSKQEVSLYPNPNDGRFTLSLAPAAASDCLLTVYNKLGQKIYEAVRTTNEAKTVWNLDLRPIPNGLYSLVLGNGTGRIILKMIVDH